MWGGMRVIVDGYIFVLLADEPILYLQRNSFFTVREERKLLDPKKDSRKAIELLYHEVSHPTHLTPPTQTQSNTPRAK